MHSQLSDVHVCKYCLVNRYLLPKYRKNNLNNLIPWPWFILFLIRIQYWFIVLFMHHYLFSFSITQIQLVGLFLIFFLFLFSEALYCVKLSYLGLIMFINLQMILLFSVNILLFQFHFLIKLINYNLITTFCFLLHLSSEYKKVQFQIILIN